MKHCLGLTVLALTACTSIPAEDFGVMVTPVRHFNPPGVEIEQGRRWVFGWVRVPSEEAEGYRIELGSAADNRVVAAATSAPGYTSEKFRDFYREEARRFAEVELKTRGLCPNGVTMASGVSADAKTRTPGYVVRCVTDKG